MIFISCLLVTLLLASFSMLLGDKSTIGSIMFMLSYIGVYLTIVGAMADILMYLTKGASSGRE